MPPNQTELGAPARPSQHGGPGRAADLADGGHGTVVGEAVTGGAVDETGAVVEVVVVLVVVVDVAAVASSTWACRLMR